MAYLAHSLVQLRAEIDHRWPVRDRSSDGWLGDAAHMSTVSEHNPDAKGCVHALDTDTSNVDKAQILAAAKVHPSTWYIICDKLIYRRKTGFVAEPYTGINPHYTHIHVSILLTATAESSERVWLPRPTLRRGMDGLEVKELQREVGAAPVTGFFGTITEGKVMEFQRRHSLTPDGVVGPSTWKAITDAYA